MAGFLSIIEERRTGGLKKVYSCRMILISGNIYPHPGLFPEEEGI